MLHFTKTLLGISVLIAPWSVAAERPGAAPVTLESRLRQPSSFGLQAHAVKDGAALGANAVIPIWGTGRPVLLGQVYGFKGDSSLGGIGAGLILRYRLAATRMVEANAFMEGLQDRRGLSYPQIGVGLAYSEKWFTARVNGYFPLRGGDNRVVETDHRTTREFHRDGRLVEVESSRNTFEHRSPGTGFDAEFEFRLPEPPRWVDPHLVLGYYYREADDQSAANSGMIVRGELHFGENWIVEGEWRGDGDDIGQEYRFVLRYQKWFGGGSAERAEPLSLASSYMDRAMSAPVERQPWPAVTRVRREGDARRGSTRLIALPTPEGSAPKPDDCCPSAEGPLIFN